MGIAYSDDVQVFGTVESISAKFPSSMMPREQHLDDDLLRMPAIDWIARDIVVSKEYPVALGIIGWMSASKSLILRTCQWFALRNFEVRGIGNHQ